MRMNKGKPFMHVEEDGGSAPTFSEAFLYERVGKGDARFILGVAEEYEHVIDALGPAAVRAILDVKPVLVNRLGTGEKVVEWLADARSYDGEYADERFPPQVILDAGSMDTVWRILHGEYTRYFDPENAMEKDLLRAYNVLTDALGQQYQKKRQAERDRLPEKLAKQAERKAEADARREARRNREKINAQVIQALEGKADATEALRAYVELNGPVKV